MFSRLYIHIPWCLAKCSYCNFYSQQLQQEELEQSCDLLIRSLEMAAAEIRAFQPLDSIYFGGGTPSLLSPEQVVRLLGVSARLFGHARDAEITLEANPGTVDISSLQGFAAAGVNRLSIGAQSFNDQMLRLLGRPHSSHNITQAVQMARQADFGSVGLDLICGLPGQQLLDWQDDLQQAVQQRPEHLSIYCLTIEEGTALHQQVVSGQLALPDDDLTATMLLEADSFLTQNGYNHYEIANYALPGHRSSHNSGYWQRDGYLGIGPAAHSFLKKGWGLRYGNPANYLDWAESIRSGCLPHLDIQRLSRQDARDESLFLGLRMGDGICLERFRQQFGEDLMQTSGVLLGQLEAAGLLLVQNNRIKLTGQGMVLSNQVFHRLIGDFDGTEV